MAKWTKFDRKKLKLMDALMLLDNIVDESDPDVSSKHRLHIGLYS